MKIIVKALTPVAPRRGNTPRVTIRQGVKMAGKIGSRGRK